jgi:hypothetical protein
MHSKVHVCHSAEPCRSLELLIVSLILSEQFFYLFKFQNCGVVGLPFLSIVNQSKLSDIILSFLKFYIKLPL